MHKVDKLKKYIDTTILIKINKNFNIRMSKDMVKKYENGSYDNAINHFKAYIRQINKIGIQYPANSKPVFYEYMVPDESFVELLDFPYKNSKSGGRPVSCYDIDGFNDADGASQNLLENMPKVHNVQRVVNEIHELAHLVHGMFFEKNRFISEGFAETLPLYILDYESKFDKHREAIKALKPEQIFSVKDLLEIEKNNSFNGEPIIKGGSCAFILSYMSSYLFVRGCIETITTKFDINKAQATQKFLEIVRHSNYTSEWLIYDIADELNISREELLEKKTLQHKTIDNIINN